MMGSTYNGQFEPVERVDTVLEDIFLVSGLLCIFIRSPLPGARTYSGLSASFC